MNAADFIHFNSWLVQNAELPINTIQLGQKMTDEIWSTTKIRNQRWKSTFAELVPRLKQVDELNSDWSAFFSLTHELLVAESLSRIFFAVLSTATDDSDVFDIADQILIDGKQVKYQSLMKLQVVPVKIQPEAENTILLKSMVERSTDLMLSQLPNHQIARRFVYSKQSFDEFVNCAHGHRRQTIRQANIALALSFSQEIQRLAGNFSGNSDINTRIAQSITGLFLAIDPETLPHFLRPNLLLA